MKLSLWVPVVAAAGVVSGGVAHAQFLCVRSEDQKVVASDLATGDIYGGAVAADGDVVLVAGEWNDDFGTDSGSVYVYRYNGATWDEEQKLVPSDSQAGDNFGRSVSLRGNVAIVGTHWDDDNGSKSGSAYVYRYNGSSWVEEQKLLASDGAVEDRFGNSVSMSSDVLGVGAWLEGSGGQGAAYIFRYNGSSWVQQQKLTASDAGPGDNFGRYVSVSGNVAIVGAWKDDDGGPDAGAAYVFRFNGATWVQEQKLVASDAGGTDLFGWAAYVDGNVAAVGSYQDDDGGTNAGAVYVFRFNGSTWVEEQKLLASDAKALESFGYAVDLVDDELLIGAPLEGATGTTAGSAYLFRYDGSSWVERQKLIPSDGAANDKFAFHLALAENVAVSGAWRDDDAGADSGSAYIFERGGGFHHPLNGSPCAISLLAGGTQSMVIDMGAAYAGSLYWIFGSVTGTTPGITFPGGINLPLQFDPYFKLTLAHPFFGIFGGFVALLDGDGEALASLTLPPGSDPGLAGVTLFHALTVSAVFGTVDAASNAISVLLDT